MLLFQFDIPDSPSSSDSSLVVICESLYSLLSVVLSITFTCHIPYIGPLVWPDYVIHLLPQFIIVMLILLLTWM